MSDSQGAEVGVQDHDGRRVHYWEGDVIAVGDDARDFVTQLVGPVGLTTIDLARCVSAPVYLFRGDIDSPEVVRQATENRHRVQLNHVLFTHADRCCPEGSEGPHPLANPDFTANPVKANPVKDNVKSAAVPVAARALPQAAGGDEVPAARIWILDTGLAAVGTDSLLAPSSTITGDRTDVLDADTNMLVDVVAGHGTFIAGIIRQLGPKCTIEVLDVMDEYGRVLEVGAPGGQSSGLLDVMNDVLKLADEFSILNLSFGGDLDHPRGQLFAQMVSRAIERGAVVVASAGNDASCRPTYPAAFDGVVSVGAVDAERKPAWFTNYGSWVRTNALGVDVASTFLQANGQQGPPAEPSPNIQDFTSGWARWSGTSFAAPVVTAMVALGINAKNSAGQALADLLERGEPIDCLGVNVAHDRVSELFSDPSS